MDPSESSRMRLKSDFHLKKRATEEAPRSRANTERNLNNAVKNYAGGSGNFGASSAESKLNNSFMSSYPSPELALSQPQFRPKANTDGININININQSGGITSVLKLGLYNNNEYKNSDSSPSSGLSPRKNDDMSFSFQPATKLNSEPLTPNSLKNRLSYATGRDRISSSPRTAF